MTLLCDKTWRHMTACSILRNVWGFGGTYCFHLQGIKVRSLKTEAVCSFEVSLTLYRKAVWPVCTCHAVMKPYTWLLTELVTAGEEVRNVGLHVAHLRRHVDMAHLQVPVTGNSHQVTLHLARSRHVTCKQYPATQGIVMWRASGGLAVLILNLCVRCASVADHFHVLAAVPPYPLGPRFTWTFRWTHIAYLRQECHNSKFGIFELLV